MSDTNNSRLHGHDRHFCFLKVFFVLSCFVCVTLVARVLVSTLPSFPHR